MDAGAAATLGDQSSWNRHRRGGKISEKLAREIVADILLRNLQPGSMLPPEAAMIEAYKVGRATLREAIRLLEVQGVLSVKTGPGGGPVVAQLTAHDFAQMAKLHLQMRRSTYREVLAARMAIEPLMARLAAQAKDRAGLAALRRVIDGFSDDTEELWQQGADAFHTIVGTISGNSVLDLLGSSLRIIYHSRLEGSVTPVGLRSEITSVHRQIGEAILAGQAEAAESLMRSHMADYAARSAKRHPTELNRAVDWGD